MKLDEAEGDLAVCMNDLEMKRAALNTVLAQLESLNKSFRAKKNKKKVGPSHNLLYPTALSRMLCCLGLSTRLPA